MTRFELTRDDEERCMSTTYLAWAAATGAAGCGRCATAA